LNHKFPFSPLSPAPLPAQKTNLYSILLLFPNLIWLNGFSRVTYLLPKVRNILDFVSIGDLPLSLTTRQPVIQKLGKVFIRPTKHTEYNAI